MISDSERREVARRLREYVDIPDDWWADTYSGFYVEKCVFGDVERHRESELFVRLADLIDPDTTTDTTKSPELTTKCDRDALLELADEFDGKADYIASCIESMDGDLDMHAVEAEAEQREYARRIREACGEVEE